MKRAFDAVGLVPLAYIVSVASGLKPKPSMVISYCKRQPWEHLRRDGRLLFYERTTLNAFWRKFSQMTY